MAEDYDVFSLAKRSKKLSEAQRRAYQNDINDIKKILKTPEGRRFIWRIWSECRIFQNPYHPNNSQHCMNSGRMGVGLDLLADVNEADGSAFAQMQNEYVSALKSKKEAQSG